MKKVPNNVKKRLGRYNYWRKSLGLTTLEKAKKVLQFPDNSNCSACQAACQSDPCQADPTCDFD